MVEWQREHLLRKLIDRLNMPPYLFLSREDDDGVRGMGKHGFRSVPLHPMLSNANRIFRLKRSWSKAVFLTIIPRARMGSESIAHEAVGRMGY